MPPAPGQELGRWLYNELRAAILDGRLKPGCRVPSTRGLSRQYALARGTVETAFDQLKSEGYVEATVGAGTFVCTRLPEEAVAAPCHTAGPPAEDSTAGLSSRGRTAVEGVRLLAASHSVGRAFRSYEPAIDLFPVALWSRVAARVLRNAPRSLYGQGDALGYLPLRKAVAQYVGPARGVRCDANQIVITSGTQQALDLVARLLLDPGDSVWLEDPGYPGALYAFRAAGANVVPVPVDREGLMVHQATAECAAARLAYVTPANQFPLGVTLSPRRRVELLTWVAARNAWIIEDEYDAEYRYSGPPVPSLQSLDRSGCVIYLGTFTKMLFNSLRLGFMVLPPRVVEAFAAGRALLDRHPPTLDQAILADFIMEGHFGHHVRRMRQTYARRGSALCDAARILAGRLDVVPALSGMRALGLLGGGQRAVDVAERARSLGLEVAALSDLALRHACPEALILGFAGCSTAELKRGIEMLAGALEPASSTPRARHLEHDSAAV